MLDHHLWDPHRLTGAKDLIDRTVIVMLIGVLSLTSKQLVKGLREDCLLAPPKNLHALLVQMYNLSLDINDADSDWECIQNTVWGHMIDFCPGRKCWYVTMHEFAVEVMTLHALSVAFLGNLRAIFPDIVIANGVADGIYLAAVNARRGESAIPTPTHEDSHDIGLRRVAVKELMNLKGLLWGVVVLGVTVFISGCVTRETYESQVKRATNLQRLLADEEKKRNTDVRKFRRQVRDLETQNLELEDRNREMSAQVAALQDEEERMREEMGFLQFQPTSIPDIEEFTIDIDSFPPLESFEVPETDSAFEGDFLGTTKQPIYHEIQRGDTLWSVSRRYNTKVAVLKELNGLTGDRIYVGQSLIVGSR